MEIKSEKVSVRLRERVKIAWRIFDLDKSGTNDRDKEEEKKRNEKKQTLETV